MAPVLLANFRMRLASAILLGAMMGAAGQASEPSSRAPLDGRSFHGTVRATGLLGLFGRSGTLTFKDGRLAWRVNAEDRDYEPAPYDVKGSGDSIVFTARMLGRQGDRVDWNGKYDGQALKDVRIFWTRTKGDFIHDLLLPDVVELTFTPE